MDIQRHEVGNNGYSSGELDFRNSAGPSRFRLSQPCGETVESSTPGVLVRELLHHISELRVRVECLENRMPSPHHAGLAFNTEAEPQPTQDVFDDPDEVGGAEPELAAQEDGGPLADLPRGPLSIEVAATALGKSVRTIRLWAQVEKYEIPAHKEAGHWRFYKDELVAWYADYEAISRRDAKRAQARRRRTKHG